MEKRLLCIVDSLNTGGAETFLMKLYRTFDKAEYQMDFISCDDGFYDNEVLSYGGRIYKIPMRTGDPLGSFKALKQVIADNHYSRVLKLSSSPIAAIDLLAAKQGGAEVLAVRSCNASSEDGTARKIINFLLRPLFNHLVNVRIAPSDLAAEFTFGHKAVEQGKVFFLHNGVDIDVFHYDPSGRSRIREEFGLTDEVVIGHVGRFNHQKNHKFLLEIFHEFHQKNPNSVLMLVGKGELEQEIREQVKTLGLEKSVIFTGVRKDIPQLLSAMDAFLFPSFYEGMPNTVIEAQSAGLPCVISDTITREADITGLVQYVPLELSAEQWARKLDGIQDRDRAAYSAVLKSKGYDIQSVAAEACRILFGDSV